MVAIRWILAPIIRGASNGGLLFALGFVLGKMTLGLILGGVGLGLGLVHGFCLAYADSYDWGSPSGWIKFILDNSWSVLNSFAASIYVLINLITLNSIHPESQGTGAVVLDRGFLPGYATTIGNVIAGSNPAVQEHELLHVLQARIFGTAYIPLVLVSYVVGTFVPYWLIYHDHSRWPINGIGTYFLNGVYPHAWNEEWAYRACP